MSQYLLNEIKEINNKMIPIAEYPKEAKVLRNKINNVTKLKQLYICKMLYNTTIDLKSLIFIF